MGRKLIYPRRVRSLRRRYGRQLIVNLKRKDWVIPEDYPFFVKLAFLRIRQVLGLEPTSKDVEDN
jgi:hypothetical protein